MDVTALLNANPFAVDQQRKVLEVLRLPTRNRTPWDAGGYSLPFNTTTAIRSPNPSSEFVHQNLDDSQTAATPTSPVHKFTDSRSSLSSFTSSLHSTTHSRYSSISTVNSPRTLDKTLAEQNLSPKITTPKTVEMSSVLPSEGSTRPSTSASESRSQDELSPTKSLDTLALIAEQHQLGNLHESTDHTMMHSKGDDKRDTQDVHSQESIAKKPTLQHRKTSSSNMQGNHNAAGRSDTHATNNKFDMDDACGKRVENGKNGAESKDKVNAQERPASPSDTLLIKRTIIPTLRVNTREYHFDDLHPLHCQQGSFPSIGSSIHHEELSNNSYHKRAVSAPNLAVQQNISTMADSRPQHRRAENTPPSSQHPDHPSPKTPFEYSPPDTPPATAAEADSEPVCMYIDDCDTASPQRKAISHIFGRNKMCTRMVPEHVWVHLCRKHYQRSRYRNPKLYANVQCDLVQAQIRRIHDWSLENLNSGSGGFVQNWTLALRKREQKRLEELNGPKRKRASCIQDEDDQVNRDDVGYPAPQTSVPDWLLALCGGEFTTEGVVEIFNRLHQQILDDIVPCFPDIEILPNIVLGQEDAKKGVVKKLHQRAQSQPNTHESKFRDHLQKRRRTNEDSSSDRTLHSPQQMSRRPTYPSIDEHGADENEYPTYKRAIFQAPLPAPIPQRLNSQSMAAHLETDNARVRIERRPSHSRSQSDVSGFVRGPSHHSAYRSTEHGVDLNHRPRDSLSYGRVDVNNSMHNQQQPRSYRPTADTLPPGAKGTTQPPVYQSATNTFQSGLRDMDQLPSLGHTRHYSSPMISRPTYSIPPVANTSSSHPSPLPPAQSNKPVLPIPLIREAKETQDRYCSRS